MVVVMVSDGCSDDRAVYSCQHLSPAMTTSSEQWPPQWAGRQIYSHLNVEAVARQECKHVIVSSKNINYVPLAQHVPPPALHRQAGSIDF